MAILAPSSPLREQLVRRCHALRAYICPSPDEDFDPGHKTLCLFSLLGLYLCVRPEDWPTVERREGGRESCHGGRGAGEHCRDQDVVVMQEGGHREGQHPDSRAEGRGYRR